MDIASKKIAISEYLDRLYNISKNNSMDYIRARLNSYKDSVFEEIKYDAYEDLRENKNFDLHKRKEILEELEAKMNSIKFKFNEEHIEDSYSSLKELRNIIGQLRKQLNVINQFSSEGSILGVFFDLTIVDNENMSTHKKHYNNDRGDFQKYKINVNGELRNIYKIVERLPIEVARDIDKQVEKLIELYDSERYDRCIELLDKRLKKAIDETDKRLIKNEQIRNIEVIMKQYEQYLSSILDMCENFFEDLPKGEAE